MFLSKDSENAKAVGPTPEEIARLEAEDNTSQASTPEASRAPSRLATSSHQAASTSETPSTPGTPGSIPSDTASSGEDQLGGCHAFLYNCDHIKLR